MNEDEKDQGPVDPDRTVYDPAVRAKSDGPTAPAEGEKGADKGWGSSASAPRREPEPTILARPEEQAPDGGRGGPREGAGRFAPRAEGSTIQVGDILNHIFEVKRFIARGGMGEVFEGANVNSDERVAIKVILPSLAADPNVISMFLKEARTLTRVQHEALVSYRVLAQEPQLDVLYIVTEYIDGLNLADALGVITPSTAELTALLRRLASGLRSAHELGAIHRDISPDNVLLQEGKLSRAKIIDFGIAKDLDPGSATIVGDGFAGKLNYVAPEQLGDYDRDIGPWTDVYSLALVILAVAGGRHVSMGGSLVAAVDKRRAGPDLSAAPEALRDLLGRMLKADPAERLRSMEQVLEALDRPARAAAGPAAPGPLRIAMRRLEALPRPVLIGGGIGAAVLALGLFLLLPSGEAPVRNDVAPIPASAAAEVRRDPVATARSSIDSVLPRVDCAWLDIVDISSGSGRLTVRMAGVAGSTGAVQSDISRALEGVDVSVNLDFGEVVPIQAAGCSALNAFRQIRAAEGGRLSTPQRQFEMSTQEDGRNESTAIVDFRFSDPTQDFTILSIESSGEITRLLPSRAAFLANSMVDSLGNGRYRFQLGLDQVGWTGLLLITGTGPFEERIVSPRLEARGPEWLRSFVSTASARGWRAEMVWLKSVDDQPNGASPARP